MKKRSAESEILEELFGALKISRGYFVEFGAWDGVHLSITRTLREAGWSGLLVEGDAEKFASLQKKVTQADVRLMHRWIQPSGPDRLDAVLTEAGAPKDPDLLSIDIDSDDLSVWMSLTQFRPKCVVIEFNITIPFDTDFVNPRGRNWGNAPLTIYKFARAKGYALIGIAGMNLIFVDGPLLAGSGREEIVLPTRTLPPLPRYFWGYDGTLLVSGKAAEVIPVPFHQYEFAQPMPKSLRLWHLGKEAHRRERFFSFIKLWLTRPSTMLSRPSRKQSS